MLLLRHADQLRSIANTVDTNTLHQLDMQVEATSALTLIQAIRCGKIHRLCGLTQLSDCGRPKLMMLYRARIVRYASKLEMSKDR